MKRQNENYSIKVSWPMCFAQKTSRKRKVLWIDGSDNRIRLILLFVLCRCHSALQDSSCMWTHSSSEFFLQFHPFSSPFSSAFHSCSMLKRVWMCVYVYAGKGERQKKRGKIIIIWPIVHIYDFIMFVCLVKHLSPSQLQMQYMPKHRNQETHEPAALLASFFARVISFLLDVEPFILRRSKRNPVFFLRCSSPRKHILC